MNKRGPLLSAKEILSEQKVNIIEKELVFKDVEPKKDLERFPLKEKVNSQSFHNNDSFIEILKRENESLFSQLILRNEEIINLRERIQSLSANFSESESKCLNLEEKLASQTFYLENLEKQRQIFQIEKPQMQQIQENINAKDSGFIEGLKKEIEELNEERINLREKIQEIELQSIDQEKELRYFQGILQEKTKESDQLYQDIDNLKASLKEQTEFFGKEIENFLKLSSSSMSFENQQVMNLYKEISFLKLEIKKNSNVQDYVHNLESALTKLQSKDEELIKSEIHSLHKKLNERNEILSKLEVYKEESKRASLQMHEIIKNSYHEMGISFHGNQKDHIVSLVKDLSILAIQKCKYSKISEETLKRQDERIRSLENEIETLINNIEVSKNAIQQEKLNHSKSIISPDQAEEFVQQYEKLVEDNLNANNKIANLSHEVNYWKIKCKELELVKEENKLFKGKFHQLIKISQSNHSNNKSSQKSKSSQKHDIKSHSNIYFRTEETQRNRFPIKNDFEDNTSFYK